MSSSSAPRRTNVYVDGWNLYYGCLKDTRYRWLNVAEMASRALPPGHVVRRTRYFTATVTARASNPGQELRQLIYLRALGTVPDLAIHYGKFLVNAKVRELVTPLPNGVNRLPVWIPEEKGSDVNIATYMLLDAFHQEYEVAALVTDDSDLAETVTVLRQELSVDVIVLSPRGKSQQLKQVATDFRHINRSALSRSQFPPVMRDAQGQFYKPSSW
jgi:hypothetical protein